MVYNGDIFSTRGKIFPPIQRSTRDIRDTASNIYKIKTGEERSFSRDWNRNFLRRHSDELDKIKTCSADDDRANIDLEEVKRYIAQVERILSNDTNRLLVLNMDETGLGRRPEKGKGKNVIISKRCTVQPFLIFLKILKNWKFGLKKKRV